MRYVLVIGVLAVAMVSCNQDPPIDSTVRPGQFAIEYRPDLSGDGSLVYFVSLDTIRPEESGVFRAGTAVPIRVQLPIAASSDWAAVQSLTVAPSQARLALLQGTQLWWCHPATDSVFHIAAVGDWETAEYVSDGALILGRDSLLYVGSADGSNPSFLLYGYEPRSEGTDQFVCIQPGLNNTWYFVLASLNGPLDTLYTLADVERPRWPDLDSAGEWLAYTRAAGDSFTVQTVRLANRAKTAVATTRYPQVCMAAYNLLLFTGPNGLLYRIAFTGGEAVPWIHAEDGEV